MNVIENLKPNQHKTQGFPLPPPPSKPRKRKLPQNTFLSFLDQIQGGFYSSSKLVRNEPRTNRDIYFVVRTFKAEVRSNRRNYSHRSVALYRTKKEGSTRRNIEYITCSFLELDGSTDNKIKTQGDILTLVKKNNLPTASYTIETSKGHFHLIWDYNNPLPWNERNESYWASQQKRLIELFRRAGFNVDKGASMNPTQNLRNPSQLQPYSFKRKCKVEIHSSYQKTSLRAIYKALNGTNIANPKRVQAGVKLWRYSRANKTFTLTHKELAINLGVSLRTEKREVKKAIANGDIKIIARLGNNSEKTRTTQYESLIFIEQFPEVPLSSIKNNSLPAEDLLRDLKQKGTSVGRRNRSLFALGLLLKTQLGKRACIEAIRAELLGGSRLCHVPRKEFERTLKNVMKPVYTHPLGLAKMEEWGLLERRKTAVISLH